jgi:hypothetical protein
VFADITTELNIEIANGGVYVYVTECTGRATQGTGCYGGPLL